ncbi:MAG: DNA polymerase III subunit delta' [Clostridia bacterium]|nr:DNA polymerase III subunit delta' [Clostridia bacterium]
MTNLAQEGQKRAPAFQDFEGQGAVFHSLRKDLALGQGVHAYLFCGPRGVGKRTLAALTGQGFLCNGPTKPCGQCPACKRVLDGNHPDVTVVQSEKTIGVDTIRELLRQASEHTYEGGRRIIRIEGAEKMTPQAQNSLLKTLEEPNQETVFLLTCDDVTRLLPTIISRCRMLKLHPWPDAYISQVLANQGISPERANLAASVSSGSIGAALACAGDDSYWERREQLLKTVFSLKDTGGICQVSALYKEAKDVADEWLSTVEGMIREVMLVRLQQRSQQSLEGYPQPWQRAAREAPLETFDALLTAVFNARRLKANQVNWQAAMETLLLSITEELKPWQL